MNKPNFFLVGWPKTGSTSLHYYLSQHPDVFMSKIKESYFFCTDIIRESDEINAGVNYKFRTEESYQTVFDGYAQEKILGESSVFYIVSKEAAQNIKSYAPDAKILVIIREPVELISSWFFYLNFHARESSGSLQEALKLQEDRKNLINLPENTHSPIHLQYDNLVDFPTHLKRLFKHFKRENIKIIIYDDFKEQKEKTVQDIFNFLSVDPEFTPDYAKKNVSRQVKFKKVKYEFDKRKRVLSNVLQKIGVLKNGNFLHRAYLNLFSTPDQRRQISDIEKKKLKEKYYPLVKETSELIGVNLLEKWQY